MSREKEGLAIGYQQSVVSGGKKELCFMGMYTIINII